MFDTIVLLTGPVEQGASASALRGHNTQLAVYPVTTPEHLAALDVDILRRARLIAFSSPVIVPPLVLAALGYGAYNFHPGPPEYPGWAPAHFALYDGATEFGATLPVAVTPQPAALRSSAARDACSSGFRMGRPQA
jgi:methionyl-tRNA formyltransferase